MKALFMSMRWNFFSLVVGLCCLFSADAAQAQANPPRMYTSRTFQVMTDLPPDKAEELLKKLETMMKLVADYFGQPCRKPIQMYVVDELSSWPPEEFQKWPDIAQAKIRSKEGVTVSTLRTIGGTRVDASAVVYADSDHGTAQHEAIHAYCGLTFGSTGPVWYSEGMAEVGQYFREGEQGVSARPEIIRFLKSQSPKPLAEIVNNPVEATGDSWQNYAWRWAVCQLLGMNKNYAPRFKPLGLALLAGKDVSFASVYGTQIPEIDFEYRLFLQDLTEGYRNDLCSWDWESKFRSLSGAQQLPAKVEAARGWQASRINVKPGTTYQVTATGTWTLAAGATPCTVAGDDNGQGKLLGIVFHDYTLSEPFEIGAQETFTVPSEGKLFLRCGDDWGSLGDNKGAIALKIKQVGK